MLGCRWLSIVLVLMWCCGDPSQPARDAGADAQQDGGADAQQDGGADASLDIGLDLATDTAVTCATDSHCSDGVFCNGIERCRPGEPSADGRGCLVGANPCTTGTRCDENMDRCEFVCGAMRDADGDGVDAVACGGSDCDDTDPNRYPGNPETCDTTDEDCDPTTLGSIDDDEDGFTAARCCNPVANGSSCGTDCDDLRADKHPGAAELCDTEDNNCNGVADDGRTTNVFYRDADADGAGDPNAPITAPSCAAPTGFVQLGNDCDDGTASVRPGGIELCDRLDNDCSRGIAGAGVDTSEDSDGDGHAQPGHACMGGLPKDDCNDANASVVNTIVDVVARPLAPAHGAYTGSRRAPAARMTLRPRFAWEQIDCATRYEIEIDDSCTTTSCTFPSPEARVTNLTTNQHVPTADLAVRTSVPVGARYFWRVRGCQGAAASTCTLWSSARSVFVGRTRGDVNGDGYGDIAASALGWDGPGSATDAGRIHIYHGSATGLETAPAISFTDTMPVRSGDLRPLALADLNVDGYADLIATGERAQAGGMSLGVAFFFGGSSAGIRAFTDPSSMVVRTNASLHQGFHAASGDVNGDGAIDAIVSAGIAQADRGAVVFYDGEVSATFGAVNAEETGWLDSPDPSLVYRFGMSIASGDIDNDGFDELAVGSGSDLVGPNRAGLVALYRGNVNGLMRGNRATADVIIRNPTPTTDTGFGRSLWIDDLDGDSYPELIVGMPNHRETTPPTPPRVYIYRGSEEGVVLANPLRINDPLGSTRFGTNITTADLDADGRRELVISAPHAPVRFGGSRYSVAGVVFVYEVSATSPLTFERHQLVTPRPSTERYYGWTNVADVNGDGIDDLVVGSIPSTAVPYIHVLTGSTSGIPTNVSQSIVPIDGAGAAFGPIATSR